MAVAALLAAGCASSPPVPTRISGTLQAAADINPDARGRASPLVVKVYELKSPTAFERADFFSLFDRDRETLAAELAAVEEFQMLPGSSRSFDKTLQPGTRYLGVLAAFRDLERSQWRATFVLPPKASKVTISLDGRTAAIKPAQ